MSQLAERYRSVLERIERAANLARRSGAEIELVVVTKNHPAQLVLDLVELGARHFGENRDQEAAPKAAAVGDALSGSQAAHEISWHFVGQLQSNKVKSVLGYASTIHSLDRPSLLQALAKEHVKLADQGTPKSTDVFIELNLTDDPNRGGIPPGALVEFAEAVLKVPQLQLLGVMGVAALDGQPERDFEMIRSCSERLRANAPGAKYISAGMSGDFELAIAHGATHLRVGTAITGQRHY